MSSIHTPHTPRLNWTKFLSQLDHKNLIEVLPNDNIFENSTDTLDATDICSQDSVYFSDDEKYSNFNLDPPEANLEIEVETEFGIEVETESEIDDIPIETLNFIRLNLLDDVEFDELNSG